MSDEIGRSGRNPIPLHDNFEIMKYIERRYGDIGYFMNGQSVVKVDKEDIKLYQLKLDTGEYLNLYFS